MEKPVEKKLWWHEPLRVIQTNLQVADTPRMQPGKLAAGVEAMGANVLVMNVGGIYAWYPSRVRFHHINEYLPQAGDLLAELIEACHERGIRVVARFDFSKTDDHVYQQRPWWFVKDAQGNPRIYGKERPGAWSLLYTTCLNGGYRGEDFAVPVMREVLRNYGIDGVFFNAPHYEYCACEACREKYRAAYGEALPEDPKALRADWALACVRECVGKIYDTIKRESPDMPLILYYGAKARENLYDRLAMADMLCTEAQDVLSRGWRDIPPVWEPAMAMKAGCAVRMPSPFGIIHSCPGMDWRHTGLPPAEYRFWMSQIPANGGSIWHSVTGFPDTISDKRILDAITGVNHQIQRCEADMRGAVSAAEVALLWDGGAAACGWFGALIATHVQFDLLDELNLPAEALSRYRAVVMPEGFAVTPRHTELLRGYVERGGALLAEGVEKWHLEGLWPVLGVAQAMETSGDLAAAYLRLSEGGWTPDGLEHTPMLPLRGKVLYLRAAEGARVLATLVPPFAPLDAVGAPPERASILCPETDLPLLVEHRYGQGKALFFCCQASMMIERYRLADHYALLRGCVDALLDHRPVLKMPHINGLQAVLYRKEGGYLLHLVNGVGQRPLSSQVTLHDVRFSLRVEAGAGTASTCAESLLGGVEIDAGLGDGYLHCTVPRLDVWDAIRIRIQPHS